MLRQLPAAHQEAIRLVDLEGATQVRRLPTLAIDPHLGVGGLNAKDEQAAIGVGAGLNTGPEVLPTCGGVTD